MSRHDSLELENRTKMYNIGVKKMSKDIPTAQMIQVCQNLAVNQDWIKNYTRLKLFGWFLLGWFEKIKDVLHQRPNFDSIQGLGNYQNGSIPSEPSSTSNSEQVLRPPSETQIRVTVEMPKTPILPNMESSDEDDDEPDDRLRID